MYTSMKCRLKCRFNRRSSVRHTEKKRCIDSHIAYGAHRSQLWAQFLLRFIASSQRPSRLPDEPSDPFSGPIVRVLIVCVASAPMRPISSCNGAAAVQKNSKTCNAATHDAAQARPLRREPAAAQARCGTGPSRDDVGSAATVPDLTTMELPLSPAAARRFGSPLQLRGPAAHSNLVADGGGVLSPAKKTGITDENSGISTLSPAKKAVLAAAPTALGTCIASCGLGTCPAAAAHRSCARCLQFSAFPQGRLLPAC